MNAATNGYRSTGWLAGLLACSLMAGCAAVGPNYETPELQVPADFHTELGPGVEAGTTDEVALAQWWTVLGDDVLNGLIEAAINGNRDLLEAEARVREARARRGVAAADLAPVVNVSGSAVSSRSSDNAGSGQRNELYAIGFDAGWELDIFGGTRRSVEASQADVDASREDFRAARLSLMAEVALNYLDVRTLQARLDVAKANLATQIDTHNLANWRNQAGLTSALDVEQATYNLENTRSQIPTLESSLDAAMNRLAVLTGMPAGTLHSDLSTPVPIPVSTRAVAVGIPADSIRRRPDIRRAERVLAGETARVGVATADLYPRFTLAGSIGLDSSTGSNLFDSDNRFDSASAGIFAPIFNAGQIRQNIAVRDAIQEQALAAYETAVLTALEEVENALSAYAKEQTRRDALTVAANAAERASQLAELEYEAGLTDFQEVLEAQRSLLSFQDQLAQSTGLVTSGLISLYKAMGGGWHSADDATVR